MTDNLTGPELFSVVNRDIDAALEDAEASNGERALAVAVAQATATQANTAALVMLAGLYADAHGMRSRELEVWSEVIPSPALVECWGKETRRPQCAERHTEDCDYADPVPEPEPVKQEPTGPRMYVQNRHGEQGYVLEVKHVEKDDSLWYRVQFLSPGAESVLKRADSLTVIAASQVERCENGQTRDECEWGENQCELCLEAEDAEGDEIEESMGLR